MATPSAIEKMTGSELLCFRKIYNKFTSVKTLESLRDFVDIVTIYASNGTINVKSEIIENLNKIIAILTDDKSYRSKIEKMPSIDPVDSDPGDASTSAAATAATSSATSYATSSAATSSAASAAPISSPMPSDIENIISTLIAQIKANPHEIDSVVDSCVPIFAHIAMLILNCKQEDLNVGEFKECLKKFIVDNSDDRPACWHFDKGRIEDLEAEFKDDHIDMRILIRMFTCLNCGLSVDRHKVCNVYNHADYTCGNCGLEMSKHAVCNSFSGDDAPMNKYDESDRTCVKCGRKRRDHLSKKTDNGEYPCEEYMDDGQFHCKICTYSASDHVYNHYVNKLTKDVRFEFNTLMFPISLGAYDKDNIYNLLIVSSLNTILHSKCVDAVAKYIRDT